MFSLVINTSSSAYAETSSNSSQGGRDQDDFSEDWDSETAIASPTLTSADTKAAAIEAPTTTEERSVSSY